MGRKLRKINNSVFFGVCAGFAYWLGMPTWLLRLIWCLFTLAGGAGIIIYVLLAIFMPRWPEDPADYNEICT